jgi:Carboxypeptidase regulatory-like domain/TonB dependent receptor
MLKRWTAVALVIGAIVVTNLFAQGGSGALVGYIVDESGAALPGVTITASNAATGFNRSAVTTADGGYRLGPLPPGRYTLVAELSGFASINAKNVEVQVATDRTLNLTLKPAAVKEQITVTAEAPLVATTPSVGTVVSQQELQNLPLNGRQFANLGSLAPGTSLSVNGDPTKPGQLTIALNGGSGRNVNFLIDGGDNTDDTIGGALQNFNIDAVQEFKIQTMAYKAEFGRSSGGVLSVVTKSGTNNIEGSVYDFYRDKSLNQESKSESIAGAGKQPYRRSQYGVTIGGPIVKDKAHFFATYERMDRTTAYTVDTGLGLLPQYEGKSSSLPFKDQLGTAKVSVDINAKQFLQVRYGYQKNTDKYGQSSLAAPDSLGTTRNDYKSLLAGHTWQVGPNKVNEFLYQYTKFNNTITADSTNPFIYYPSGVHQGQNINTPQSTNQVKHQFKDDFSFSAELGQMHHDFKTGINYIDEPTLGGDFTSGTSGQFSVTQDQLGAPISSIIYYGGFSGDKTPVKQYNVYFQDDISVNKRLTINAGLRYDLSTGFDLNQSINPNYQMIISPAFQSKYGSTPYVGDFAGGGKLTNDKNNWGPRLGFSYDLRGDSKNILRGGLGRYYDFAYTNATILFPAMAVQSLYGPVYDYEDPNGIKNANGTFWKPGDPLPPNQVSGNLNDRTTREIASPTLATPYSDQASLGFSTEVSPSLGLNFEVVSARYRDIPFRFRANPIDPATGARRMAGVAPSNLRLWYGKGWADYDGANIGFHSRITNRFEAQGFYTYSKSKGNVLAGADEFRITAVEHQPDLNAVRDMTFGPLNPLCSACIGPLNTDARHRVTLSGVYRAMWDVNVSGIFHYHSATPYTEWAGADLNGDGYAFDPVPGQAHVNNLRGSSFSQFDFRIAKEFKVGPAGLELIGEIFNVFNSKNPAGYIGQCNYDAKSGGCTNPIFGKPTAYAGDPGQGEQRLAQLGVRIRF